MNTADELRRFEALAGERIEMVAFGPVRHWSNLETPETVAPLPRDEALAALDGEFPTGVGRGGRFNPICAWSANWVICLTGQDGDIGLAWLPRDPRRCSPCHLGLWDRGQHEEEVRPKEARAIGTADLGDEDRRFIRENGPTPEEVEDSCWSDMTTRGEEPGGVVGPADPIPPRLLFARAPWGEIDGLEAVGDANQGRRSPPTLRRSFAGEDRMMDEGDEAALARVCGFQVDTVARDVSNLVAVDDTADVAWFVELAFRTFRALPDRDRVPFWLSATHGLGGPVQALFLLDTPDDVSEEWRGWVPRYRALVARNPRLELADLIGMIGATIDSSNWPTVPSARLRAWVDRGERLPLPWASCEFDELSIDQPFYDRLRELRAATGGWVVWDEVAAMRVFVRDVDILEDDGDA